MAADDESAPHRRLDWFIPAYLENPDAFAQTQDMDFKSILTIGASNLAFGLCCLMIFESLRGRGTAFRPKVLWRPHQTPKPLPPGRLFSWVRPLLDIDDETVLRCAGIDGLVYLRFIKLALKVFALFTAVGLGLLVPVNLSCSQWVDGDEEGKYDDLSLFSQLTLSNVPAADHRLWAHVAASYILTIITMQYLVRECRVYTKLRHRFLSSRAAHLRTILVERIPRDLRSNARLFAYFARIYPGMVQSVHLSQDLSPLEALLARREHVLTVLERCIVSKSLTGEEPYHVDVPLPCQAALPVSGSRMGRLCACAVRSLGCGLCCGGKIASIPYYSNLLAQLNDSVVRGQAHRIRTMAERDNDFEIEEARQFIDGFFQRTQRWGGGGNAKDATSATPVRRPSHTTAAQDVFLDPEDAAISSYQASAPGDTELLHGQSYPVLGTGMDPGDTELPSAQWEGESDAGFDSDGFPRAFDETLSDTLERDEDEEFSDDDLFDSEHAEWNRNLCSRLFLVFQYATSTTSMVRDLKRVMCHVTGDYSKFTDLVVDDVRVVGQRQGRTGRCSPSEGELDAFEADFESGPYHSYQNAGSESDTLLDTATRGRRKLSSKRRTHRSATSVGSGGDGVRRRAVGGGDGDGDDSEAPMLPAALSEEGQMMSKAFVTFKTLSAATTAQQVLHYAKPGGMLISGAPEPRDIFWKNIYMAKQEWLYRRLIVDFIISVGLVVYVVPVTAISMVASADALKSRIPLVRFVCETSPLAETLVDMVQPMCLMGLMALLPPVILGMSYWEGTLSMSKAQLRQTSRYFLFLVVNVFLVSTVAGSVLKSLSRMVEEPGISFKMLADSLPKVSGFFCCYMLMKGLSGMSMEMARVVPVGQHLLKRLIYPAVTPRDRRAEVLGTRDFGNPGWFPYGKYCAQDLLMVVVTMTYACIAPITLLPALIFFGMAFVTYKHQLLYVYLPTFESGGAFWPKIYRRIIFALFMAQATMTGMFILKYSYPQVYFEIALMVMTYMFKRKMKATYTTSDSVTAHLPLELATSLDSAAAASKDAETGGDKDGHEYVQPALSAKAVVGPEIGASVASEKAQAGGATKLSSAEW